jgi:hypothetical protein
MSAPLKTAPPEIDSAASFNRAAAEHGWPMLCDDSCAFTSPMLASLLALWRQEAAEGIPGRKALTARKLQPFMRSLAIYERVGEGETRRYRVRLMGSGIVQFYGEMTGKFVDEVVREIYLPRWYGLCDVSLKAKIPVRILLRADSFDKSHMVTEYLCAPLKAEDGKTKFVLAGVCFDGSRPWSAVEAEARRTLNLPEQS